MMSSSHSKSIYNDDSITTYPGSVEGVADSPYAYRNTEYVTVVEGNDFNEYDYGDDHDEEFVPFIGNRSEKKKFKLVQAEAKLELMGTSIPVNIYSIGFFLILLVLVASLVFWLVSTVASKSKRKYIQRPIIGQVYDLQTTKLYAGETTIVFNISAYNGSEGGMRWNVSKNNTSTSGDNHNSEDKDIIVLEAGEEMNLSTQLHQKMKDYVESHKGDYDIQHRINRFYRVCIMFSTIKVGPQFNGMVYYPQQEPRHSNTNTVEPELVAPETTEASEGFDFGYRFVE